MARKHFCSPTSRQFYSLVVLLVLVVSVSAQSRDSNCRNPVESCDPRTDYFPESARITIEFASTIVEVSYSNTHVDITASGANRSHILPYRFIRCGCPRPPGSESRIVHFTGPSSLHVTESPSLALLEALDPSLEALSYVNTVATVFSTRIREKVLVTNEVQEVRGLDGVDFARLQGDSELSASIIGSFEFETYLEKTGDVPFLVVPDPHEPSPLGRAELVKLVGVFLGAAEEANSLFANIVTEYQDASRRAREAARRPSVLLNRPFKVETVDLSVPVDDLYTWFMPHREQYITDFLEDANADYVHERVVNDATLEFPFSRVIEDFRFARFHLFVGHSPSIPSRDTLEEYMNALIDPNVPDPRVREAMATINAVKCDNVWSNEKRVTEDGSSNDFFESAIINPDEILKDLVSILHPSVDFGDREMFYMDHFAAATDEFTQDCPYNDFAGPPPSSKIYVDNEFTVAELNRFDIERAWESDIQPELKALDFDAEYDILFEPENRANESSAEIQTRFIIRALTDPENNAEISETTEIREALTRSLGRDVGQLNSDSSIIPIDDGLSSAAIAIIVIASIVVSASAVALIFRLLQRQRGKAFELQVLPRAQVWGPPADEIGRTGKDLEAPATE